jgi:uncharacterized protein
VPHLTPNTEQSGPEAQAAFVAGMRAAVAYPHQTTSPIRCVETHISWVFLTGPYAYKVKKPVSLGFVDYSTAARRAACCREELRVNRRYAPELYVDVVPISGVRSRPKVGDRSTAPFEHAVRMRQFDQDRELSALLRRGSVQTAEIAALGASIAQAQAASTVPEVTLGFGAPARVHELLTDNFDEITRALHGAQPHAWLAMLQHRAQSLHERNHPLQEQRRTSGYVRECHGDLHCGNVVRWAGRLVPFDGLEFDPALRCIDVASDVAFLAMDLAVHERADLRRAWLNGWSEVSGDFAAIELLPYFELYRALVRAKVAVLAGEQQRRPDAERYLRWAAGQDSRSPPLIVLMVGLSGSGKTWLARQLAVTLDAFHVRSDVERKRLAGLGPLQPSASPPDAGIYTREFNDRTYARLLECARHCLAGQENVVIDAASLRREERKSFAAVAATTGARFRMVHCVAPPQTLRARVAARRREGRDASEATLDLLERQPGFWESFDAAESGSVIVADTTSPECFEHTCEAMRRAD